MLIVLYDTKKELKAAIGKPLVYTETSMFGAEYKPNGMLTVAHRPHITGRGREFFAQVWLENGIIKRVT